MVFVFLYLIYFTCMIISRSTYVAANGIISVSFMAEQYSTVCVCVCVCVYHIFFSHSSVDGHLGCFHVLGLMDHMASKLKLYF